MNEELSQAIARRIATFEENDGAIDQAHEEELRAVLSEPEAALRFIRETVSDDEVNFLVEILCDIWDVNHDDRFIDASQKRADGTADPYIRDSIQRDIDWG